MIFLLYWVMKIVDLANDKVLNSLIILSLCIYIIRFCIQSLLEWIVDREFYIRPIWLSTFYVNISVIVFCYYYEILETTSFFLLLNLGIAIIVGVYMYLKKGSYGST